MQSTSEAFASAARWDASGCWTRPSCADPVERPADARRRRRRTRPSSTPMRPRRSVSARRFSSRSRSRSGLTKSPGTPRGSSPAGARRGCAAAYAVHRQPGVALEVDEGGDRLVAEDPVDPPGSKPSGLSRRWSSATSSPRNIGDTGRGDGHRGGTRPRRVRTSSAGRDPVDAQAPLLLEGPNRTLGRLAEGAGRVVHRRSRARETLLEVGDASPVAPAEAGGRARRHRAPW